MLPSKRQLNKQLSTLRRPKLRRRERLESLREKRRRGKLSNLKKRKPCIPTRTLKIERKLRLQDRLMVITNLKQLKAIKFQRIKGSTTPRNINKWCYSKVLFTS